MARILVIEDDRVQRFAAVRALMAAGHEVDEAMDGAHGLALARAVRPDVVVCDVRMPGMDGYEVLRQLRADDVLYAMPFILLTSMTERESMRQGMASGADDYLTKPFRFDELCESVAVLLRKRKTYFHQAASVIGPKFEAALHEQTQQIAEAYQSRLTQELEHRWGHKDEALEGVALAQAALVLVDLVGGWRPNFGDPAQAQMTRRAYQAARDALYLFVPAYVVPQTNLLLAVYTPGAADTGGEALAVQRALRAAWACAQRLALSAQELGVHGGSPPGVAVHAGAVSLLHVRDELHGEGDITLASGAAVDETRQLLALAAAHGWKAGCSAAVAERAGGVLRPGREDAGAVEILGVEERGD